MKLIITIIPDDESEKVSNALTDKDFRVTQIASTGGFLRKGKSTLLVGVEDEQLDNALEIIKGTAGKGSNKDKGVLFVIKVDKFIHF